MKRNYWLPLFFSIVFVAGIWMGTLISTPKAWKNNFFSKNGKVEMAGEDKLNAILQLIDERYVDDVDIDSLIEMTLPSLLSNLDPHSSYIPAKDLASATSELEGKFSGIGVSFQIVNDTINIVEVIPGGPAEKVGVMPGDRIVKVDERDLGLEKITEDDVFSMLRGDKGTHVSIVVRRSNSKQPITFEITRDDIPVESVDAVYMVAPGVGYVRVTKFARNTYTEFLQAINKLRMQDAHSFIVDLRYNGGGYMDPAVFMANEFLPANCAIVSTKGKEKDLDQFIPSDGTGAFQDYGLVVLVNEFTASASEIFSGAIQDNDRGWIIGRRTFGKGLVQNPILLPDSSEVRLTVQRYYTPSGRCIQKTYKPGDEKAYEAEVFLRFNNGETFHADSVKFDDSLKYTTVGGRSVYGGGGIMPDIFVPEDTISANSYYRDLINQSIPIKFAFEYSDLNRAKLQKAKNVDELLKMLPRDEELLNRIANFGAQNGVNKRPAYLYKSGPYILSQTKALIARNILGQSAYVELLNRSDKTIEEALKYVNKPLN